MYQVGVIYTRLASFLENSSRISKSLQDDVVLEGFRHLVMVLWKEHFYIYIYLNS